MVNFLSLGTFFQFDNLFPCQLFLLINFSLWRSFRQELAITCHRSAASKQSAFFGSGSALRHNFSSLKLYLNKLLLLHHIWSQIYSHYLMSICNLLFSHIFVTVWTQWCSLCADQALLGCNSVLLYCCNFAVKIAYNIIWYLKKV